MKTKFLFIVVVAVISASNALGQGQVTLGNNSSSLFLTGDLNTATPAPIGSMLFQLYYAAGAGLPESSLIPVGPIVGTSPILAGRIANTIIDIPTTVVPAGGIATFQIWAWSSSFASYPHAAISGGLVGKSVTFSASTSPGIQPPPIPTSLAGLYPGFGAFLIPEPSTFVLAGLGLAALIVYCRRK